MATMVDVAAAVGVSPRTVSRIINGEGSAKASTKARVLAAAEELGYRLNPSARALKSGRKMVAGVVINRVSSDTTIKRVEVISKLFSARGYAVMIRFADTPELEAAAVRAVTPWCDGLIIFTNQSSRRNRELDSLEEQGFPFVLVDPPHRADYPAIYIDRYGGYRDATAHLLESGRRSPLLLIEQFRSAERLRGFKAALHTRGLPFLKTMVMNTGCEYAGGREAAPRLIGMVKKGQADAILCHNDKMALALLSMFHSHGIRVPEDAALIGYDDDSFDPYINPPLTSISQSGFDAGTYIFEQLIACIESGTPIKSRTIETHLVVRGSV